MVDVTAVATHIVAATAMLALGAGLLYLKFGSPVNRAFAAYLLVQATLLGIFAAVKSSTGNVSYLQRVNEYFAIGLVPVLAYFAVAYIAWRSHRRLLVMRAFVIGVGLALMLLYAMDNCLAACPGSADALELGPLSLFARGASVAAAAVGLVLAIDWLRRGPVAGHGGAILIALAFSLNGFFDGALFLGNLLHGEALADASPGLWASLFYPWRGVALLLAIPTLALLAIGAQRGMLLRSHVVAAAVACLVALASGLYAALESSWASVLTGVWRVAIPVLAAWALARHRLFEVEVRMGRAVGRTVVALVFLLTFFSAGVVGKTVWPEAGSWTGWVAAAVLLLAFGPLDRMGRRLARQMMPSTRPVDQLSPEERVRLYKDRVELILADGSMGVQDRVLLDRLRDQLKLPAEWAARLEREAWAMAAPRKQVRGVRA